MNDAERNDAERNDAEHADLVQELNLVKADLMSTRDILKQEIFLELLRHRAGVLVNNNHVHEFVKGTTDELKSLSELIVTRYLGD